MRTVTMTGQARDALLAAVGHTFRRDSIDPTYAQVDELADELGLLGYEIVARHPNEMPL